MFYKITNKESELYKKLHELRSKELKIEKENDAAVKKLVGDDWDHFSGWLGQQNFFSCNHIQRIRIQAPR